MSGDRVQRVRHARGSARGAVHALRLRAAVLREPSGSRRADRPRRLRRQGHPGGPGGGRGAAAPARRDARRACCSWSAKSAAATARAWPTSTRPPGVRYLINGEPTDNRLGIATRGILRVRLVASGRAAHSSFPELGESAIDKLLDALMVVRGVELPDDVELGRTHYTVGLIDGGVAPNVVSPHASAELMFRIVGEAAPVREALQRGRGPGGRRARAGHSGRADAPRVRVRDRRLPLHDRRAPADALGPPLLIGPGSIHVAHTDHEHVAIDELRHAVDIYEALADAAAGRGGRDSVHQFYLSCLAHASYLVGDEQSRAWPPWSTRSATSTSTSRFAAEHEPADRARAPDAPPRRLRGRAPGAARPRRRARSTWAPRPRPSTRSRRWATATRSTLGRGACCGRSRRPATRRSRSRSWSSTRPRATDDARRRADRRHAVRRRRRAARPARRARAGRRPTWAACSTTRCTRSC